MRRDNAGYDWTAEAVATLRQLWDEAHSASEIGRRLGASKNAVRRIQERRHWQSAQIGAAWPALAHSAGQSRCRTSGAPESGGGSKATCNHADGQGYGCECQKLGCTIRRGASHSDQPGATRVAGA